MKNVGVGRACSTNSHGSLSVVRVSFRLKYGKQFRSLKDVHLELSATFQCAGNSHVGILTF